MKLHVRECTGCNRIMIRIDGDNEWSQWRRGGYVDEIKRTHEVVRHEQIHCTDCLAKITTHVALTAGSVH